MWYIDQSESRFMAKRMCCSFASILCQRKDGSLFDNWQRRKTPSSSSGTDIEWWHRIPMCWSHDWLSGVCWSWGSLDDRCIQSRLLLPGDQSQPDICASPPPSLPLTRIAWHSSTSATVGHLWTGGPVSFHAVALNSPRTLRNPWGKEVRKGSWRKLTNKSWN